MSSSSCFATNSNLVVCFITGNADIVLLQYSSAGSLLWTRQTGTIGDDYGQGVSVSADGKFIYVTGLTSNSLNGQPHAGDVYNTISSVTYLSVVL
jgi:hypothetical protein